MEEKLQELQKIMDWYSKNANELEPLDMLEGMRATMSFAEQLRPIYEKYNKVEKEGFKILARMDK